MDYYPASGLLQGCCQHQSLGLLNHPSIRLVGESKNRYAIIRPGSLSYDLRHPFELALVDRMRRQREARVDTDMASHCREGDCVARKARPAISGGAAQIFAPYP